MVQLHQRLTEKGFQNRKRNLLNTTQRNSEARKAPLKHIYLLKLSKEFDKKYLGHTKTL